MMKTTLAIDAGGTSSRAALLDASGARLGSARAAGGNPTSSGIGSAAAQIAHAAALALASAREADPTLAIDPASVVAITQAGQLSDAYRGALLAHLEPLGFTRIVIESDLLGVFGSGSAAADGIVLVAGTGSVAGRVAGGTVVQEVGGAGWLLGDGGSGFWIARRVLRAVTADLDGLGPRSSLTALVTDALDLPDRSAGPPGASPPRRSSALETLIEAVNVPPPVAIARFAPLAFVATDDPVAGRILEEAVDQLVSLVEAVRRGAPFDGDATLVVGGSVLVEGLLSSVATASERLSAAAGGARLVPVTDGLVGAAMLGLRSLGESADETAFARVSRALSPTRQEGTP